MNHMTKLALSLPGGETIQPPEGVPRGGIGKLEEILQATLTLVLVAAIVLAIIFIILGGIRWVTSGGDAKGVEAARKQITYAIIGLVVALLALVIVNFVGDLFSTSLLGGFSE